MSTVTNEMAEEVRRGIRTALDNARAEQAVHDLFIDEYNRGISGNPDASERTHKRALELYDFTMGGLQRKRNFENEAHLLQTVLDAALGLSNCSVMAGTPFQDKDALTAHINAILDRHPNDGHQVANDLLPRINLALKGVQADAQKAAKSGEKPKSDRQIVDEVNDLARMALCWIGTGYEAPSGHKFYEAQDSRSRKSWQIAVEIYEHFTASEVHDALEAIREESQKPAKTEMTTAEHYR